MGAAPIANAQSRQVLEVEDQTPSIELRRLVAALREGERLSRAADGQRRILVRAYVSHLRILRTTAAAIAAANIVWALLRTIIGPKIILGSVPWPSETLQYVYWSIGAAAGALVGMTHLGVRLAEASAEVRADSLARPDMYFATLREIERLAGVSLRSFTFSELEQAMGHWVSQGLSGARGVVDLACAIAPGLFATPRMVGIAGLGGTNDFANHFVTIGVERGYLREERRVLGDDMIFAYECALYEPTIVDVA